MTDSRDRKKRVSQRIQPTYERPPVVEAVCEIRFAKSTPWDWTIPGLIFKEIEKDFPVKREQHRISVSMSPSQTERNQEINRMQFVRGDESELVQVGPHLLVVNQLRYRGWATFKPLILEQLRIYEQVANSVELDRIGLRYVNQINIEAERVELRDYFTVGADWPATSERACQSTFAQAELLLEDDMTLKFTFGSAPSGGTQLRFILDLDIFSMGDSIPNIRDTGPWLDAAHERLEQFFLRSFTEKAHRDLFRRLNS